MPCYFLAFVLPYQNISLQWEPEVLRGFFWVSIDWIFVIISQKVEDVQVLRSTSLFFIACFNLLTYRPLIDIKVV